MPTTITKENVGLQSGARKAMEPAWKLCRTLRGGTQSMREARTAYTPMTKKEERKPERYDARLKRSVLFPIYDSTIRKIASLPFQKAPTMSGNMPPSVQALVGNADRLGTTLATFAKTQYLDAIDRGMSLFIVDNVSTLKDDGQVMNREEVAKYDARPYFRRIVPDNLLRCEFEQRYGVDVPVLLTFRSDYWAPQPDGSELAGTRVEVWTEAAVAWWVDGGKGKWVIEREISNPLGKIPVVAIYTNRTGSFEARPPLEDLAWQNCAHWNSLSMQTEALHYCRSPILKGTGMTADPSKGPPELGPGATMIDENENANLAFVEIAGTSLAAGEVEIEKIEKRCEALGMQPLVSVSGPTTATGEVIADGNEKSEAQSWIEQVEWAIWRGIQLVSEWALLNPEPGEFPLPDDGDWTLYRDSSVVAGKATDLPNIFSALREGLVTKRTALRELVLRGTIATVEDVDAEMEELQMEADQQQANQLAIIQKQIEAERARQADTANHPPEPAPPADPKVAA